MRKTQIIYLAKAIDRATESPHGAYAAITDALISAILAYDPDSTVVVYTPGMAFSVLGPTDREAASILVSINDYALQLAKALVLRYEPGLETWGCAQEVALAYQHHILIYLIAPVGTRYESLPTYLKAYVDPNNMFTEWDWLARALCQELDPLITYTEVKGNDFGSGYGTIRLSRGGEK